MRELMGLILKFDINGLFFKNTENGLIKFFRYLFVGGIAAVAELIVFTAFVYTINIEQDIIRVSIANVLGFIAGLTTNYFLSKKFVFTEKSKTANGFIEFICYGIIGVVGLVISTAIILFFMKIFGLNEFISKVIATVLVVVYNYLARKILLYSK